MARGPLRRRVARRGRPSRIRCRDDRHSWPSWAAFAADADSAARTSRRRRWSACREPDVCGKSRGRPCCAFSSCATPVATWRSGRYPNAKSVRGKGNQDRGGRAQPDRRRLPLAIAAGNCRWRLRRRDAVGKAKRLGGVAKSRYNPGYGYLIDGLLLSGFKLFVARLPPIQFEKAEHYEEYLIQEWNPIHNRRRGRFVAWPIITNHPW